MVSNASLDVDEPPLPPVPPPVEVEVPPKIAELPVGIWKLPRPISVAWGTICCGTPLIVADCCADARVVPQKANTASAGSHNGFAVRRDCSGCLLVRATHLDGSIVTRTSYESGVSILRRLGANRTSTSARSRSLRRVVVHPCPDKGRCPGSAGARLPFARAAQPRSSPERSATCIRR